LGKKFRRNNEMSYPGNKQEYPQDYAKYGLSQRHEFSLDVAYQHVAAERIFKEMEQNAVIPANGGCRLLASVVSKSSSARIR